MNAIPPDINEDKVVALSPESPAPTKIISQDGLTSNENAALEMQMEEAPKTRSRLKTLLVVAALYVS